ncbi:hypothetical protein KUCAC02_016785 [Chaenocephalus aceratus]|nr:hypothetical protein KUCAC02_016785 [Chaenocephalus aceratus]
MPSMPPTIFPDLLLQRFRGTVTTSSCLSGPQIPRGLVGNQTPVTVAFASEGEESSLARPQDAACHET